MRGDVILIGKGANVFNAQQENSHEESYHCSGSALERPSMVLEMLSIGDRHCF